MEQIQSFTVESGGVLVPLGTKVRGNIQLIVHHIKAIPIARKANIVSGVCVCGGGEVLHTHSWWLLPLPGNDSSENVPVSVSYWVHLSLQFYSDLGKVHVYIPTPVWSSLQ